MTTIGYGSIPVVTNWERLFAMFVMAAGAVICDAGITAILTSIISNRDQQAGANSRRIQCSKRFMKTYMIEGDLQERVLNFYNYNDIELTNINETEILSDFSVSLRCEVLHFFCFQPLRSSNLLRGHSDGAVRSLAYMMVPYLAIPGEKLSLENEPCNSIFVLRSGIISAVDSSGYETLMPLGSIIGHAASKALALENGLPSKVLEIELISAQGLKTKLGNTYVIFNVGYYSCRSKVKKTRDWREDILLKLPHNSERRLDVSIKSWQNGKIHSLIGSASMSFDEKMSNVHSLEIKDLQGRNAGTLNLRLHFRDTTESEALSNDELTTVASGYCHLYSCKAHKLEQLKEYLLASKRPLLNERLTGPFLEFQQQEILSDKERVKHCWRRPSRPSLHVTTTGVKNNSLLIDRRVVQRLSVPNSETSKEAGNGYQKIEKKTSFRLLGRGDATIHPEGDNHATDVEKGLPCELKERQTWIGSNEVQTGTLASQEGSENKSSNEDMVIGTLLEDDNWDILVNLQEESFDSRKLKTSRRATFFTEWTHTTT